LPRYFLGQGSLSNCVARACGRNDLLRRGGALSNSH
jgi:hypothetical protein